MPSDTVQTRSRQPRLATTKDAMSFVWMYMDRVAREDEVPAWGRPDRLPKLRELAQEEPILSGAVASMVSKVISLDWQIVGGRNRVNRYQEILVHAEDGAGWSYLVDRWSQDYLIADLGGVLELARDGERGPVVALYNMDAARLSLTGNATRPLVYSPAVGRPVPMYPGDTTRIVDMPSPDETKFGLGFSATSRAIKAAKLLMALYHYEDEQLSDMPPQGVATVTGMTMDEV
jgi:hypothetical protein